MLVHTCALPVILTHGGDRGRHDGGAVSRFAAISAGWRLVTVALTCVLCVLTTVGLFLFATPLGLRASCQYIPAARREGKERTAHGDVLLGVFR